MKAFLPSLPFPLFLFFWCCVLDLALAAHQACALQTSFKLAEGGQWLIFKVMKWIYILTAWWLWEPTPVIRHEFFIPITPISLSYFGVTEPPGFYVTSEGNGNIIRISAVFAITQKSRVLLLPLPSLGIKSSCVVWTVLELACLQLSKACEEYRPASPHHIQLPLCWR